MSVKKIKSSFDSVCIPVTRPPTARGVTPCLCPRDHLIPSTNCPNAPMTTRSIVDKSSVCRTAQTNVSSDLPRPYILCISRHLTHKSCQRCLTKTTLYLSTREQERCAPLFRRGLPSCLSSPGIPEWVSLGYSYIAS